MEKLTIQAIQTVLWEEIQKVKDGSTTPANVNAITNATGKILSSVKLHMEYCKITGKTPEVEMFLPAADKIKAIK